MNSWRKNLGKAKGNNTGPKRGTATQLFLVISYGELNPLTLPPFNSARTSRSISHSCVAVAEAVNRNVLFYVFVCTMSFDTVYSVRLNCMQTCAMSHIITFYVISFNAKRLCHLLPWKSFLRKELLISVARTCGCSICSKILSAFVTFG